MTQDKNPSRVSSIVFVVFVIFHVSAFVAVTIVQFLKVQDLEGKLSEKRSQISDLSSSCRDNVRLRHTRFLRSLDNLADTDETFDDLWRRVEKRQGSSVADLIHQVLQAQEQQLIQQCSGNVKICMPGDAGAVGDKGDRGITGMSGQEGFPGKKGDTGTAGLKGDKGLTGIKGDNGVKGIMGVEGGTGQKGEQGDQGLDGERGNQGIKGSPGDRGDEGSPGDPGTDGAKGMAGPIGVRGSKGDIGPIGVKGPKGDPGTQGPPASLSSEQIGCQCLAPITFTDNTSIVNSRLGSRVVLNCATSSNPDATVTWYKKGSPGCYKSKITGSLLVIDSLQPTDLGKYSCFASNGFYSVNKTISVTTSDPLDVVDCDFETGLCKWQQRSDDDIDWSIRDGISSANAPSNDHTQGTTNGHFMYLDSNLGSYQTGKIESLRFPADTEQCLSFWYNLGGTDVGTLSVNSKAALLSTPKVTQDLEDYFLVKDDVFSKCVAEDCDGTQHTIYTISGDQGTVWKQKAINIPANPDGAQIVFAANGGRYSTADIAIDDISLQHGSCLSALPTFSGGNNVTLTSNVGNRATINCTASGTPDPSITWTKPGTCASFNNHGDQYTIANALWADGGRYTCTATNAEGSVKKDIYLNIRGSSFCDFQSTNKCGWTDLQSKATWERHTGGTPSSGTGPSGDHTTSGSASGYYVYMETSGRSRGDKARLQSVLLPANTQACLKYWYNMNGEDVDSLNVYTKTCKGVETKVQSMTGNKGDNWTQSCVTVAPLDYEYNLIIEGVVGRSYRGDIAIDDVGISTGSACYCSAAVHRQCVFDNGLCDWTQDTANDIFDWTTGTGETSTLFTGPSNDHTTGSGKYLYIETSNPRANGDFARLVSKELRGGQPYCMTLYYNMYGQDTGTLTVFEQTTGGATTQLFTKTGDQLQGWKHAAIDVPDPGSKFSLVIEGQRGSSYTGDIAIDDVTIESGSCNNP